MSAIHRPRWVCTAMFLGAALTLTSCTSGPTDSDVPGHASADGYPVTVENCGAEVTFDQTPERLVLLKSASAPALHMLGVLDRAVARAGAFPAEYFNDDAIEVLDGIPQLGSDIDATGHLQISQDVVIDQSPDVVFGEVENLPRQSMAQVGIPLLEEPSFCSTGSAESPSFDDVYQQLRLYGDVFDRSDRADEVISDLQQRVSAARSAADADENRTAAVLYPTVGGGTTYAYGTGSMAHPQLTAAGFTNVFEQSRDRVFEVSAEQLLAQDPDIIILLHSDGDPAAVEQALGQLPGAENLSAVQQDQVLTQLLNFTEPATPLSVDGLERIIERFHP